MSYSNLYWINLCLCAFICACDDEANTEPRVPQIEIAGMSSAGDESNLNYVCERSFVFNARGLAPQSVKLAGSFESPPWSASIELSDEDGDGQWVISTPVAVGEHQYKWIIDGEWRVDPDNLMTRNDGNGGENSVLNHSCPFEAECILHADCSNSDQRCIGFICRADERPLLCNRCEEECDMNTGDCRESLPPECDEERPCAPPLICEAGQCVPECQVDSDCSSLDPSALCLDLECVTPECYQDQECDLLEESCLAYQCVTRPCAEHLFLFDPRGENYDSVHIAGDFNADASGQWPESISAGGWPMSQLPDGRYYARYVINNGSYAYKFVLTRGGNVEWIADPLSSDLIDDGFGGQNSLLEQSCTDQPPGLGQCGDVNAFQWEDAVMYFVMVDRFYDSDGTADPVPGVTGGDARQGPSGQYEGGDLLGVTEKLTYLDNLGVNALWLSAPYNNRESAGAAIDPNSDPHTYSGYHGYWPSPANISYEDPLNPDPRPEVESRIGTEEQLHDLIDNAHLQEIKVLFDYVMNHVDSESPLAQAHPSWFARRDNGQIALCGPENLWDDVYWGTRCAFTDYLPPFNFEGTEAIAWSISDAMWWAQEYEIDGYRLDAIKHVPISWLEELRGALNRTFENPIGGRFYLVGETFAYDNAELIKSFIDRDRLLDGQFDFPFKARLCEALFRPEGRLDTFASWMNDNDLFYGEGSLMTTWIGNHDIPRAIHFASREISNCREGSSPQNGWNMSYTQPSDSAAYERLGLAFAVMLTNHGIPLIYYGDEIGLAGGGDPDNRRLMPWNDSDLLPAQRELRRFISKLTDIRAAHPNLARGRRVTLSVDQDTWVYRMLGCGGESLPVTVMINRADETRSLNLPAGSYSELLNEESLQGGEISLPARSIKILIPEGS